MKYHTYASRVREHEPPDSFTGSGGSWCSVRWGEPCTHCIRWHWGVQARQKRGRFVMVWPDNSRASGVTTTGGRPPRLLSRHSPHLHLLISSHPFHPAGTQDRCGATYLSTRSHSSTPHGPPSLVPLQPPLPQFLSFFPQSRNAHFDTAEVLAVETDLWRTTLTFVNVYIPLATFWRRN